MMLCAVVGRSGGAPWRRSLPADVGLHRARRPTAFHASSGRRACLIFTHAGRGSFLPHAFALRRPGEVWREGRSGGCQSKAGPPVQPRRHSPCQSVDVAAAVSARSGAAIQAARGEPRRPSHGAAGGRLSVPASVGGFALRCHCRQAPSPVLWSGDPRALPPHHPPRHSHSGPGKDRRGGGEVGSGAWKEWGGGREKENPVQKGA